MKKELSKSFLLLKTSIKKHSPKTQESFGHLLRLLRRNRVALFARIQGRKQYR